MIQVRIKAPDSLYITGLLANISEIKITYNSIEHVERLAEYYQLGNIIIKLETYRSEIDGSRCRKPAHSRRSRLFSLIMGKRIIVSNQLYSVTRQPIFIEMIFSWILSVAEFV